MLSIGEMARDSGLGVSALRFYDRSGVLVPAWVDPVSSYRWYEAGQLGDARLLAHLRRAGMPLADIRLVLAGWSGADTALVRGLLAAHLSRLEQGLASARSEFSTLRAHLAHRETSMTTLTTENVQLAFPAADLAAALDTVRFAASADPELPMLRGVLFDIEGDSLRVVATDRYRMAVARVGIEGHEGDRVQVVVPTPLVDAMRALLGADGTVRLAIDGGRVTLDAGDGQAAGHCPDHGFPDYRRLLPEEGRAGVLVRTAAFRAALETGPVRRDEGAGAGDGSDGGGQDCSLLKLDGDTVAVCAEADDDPSRVAVNRSYLIDALDAGDRDGLTLELVSPTAPLVIRRPGEKDGFSLLMPVRLED